MRYCAAAAVPFNELSESTNATIACPLVLATEFFLVAENQSSGILHARSSRLRRPANMEVPRTGDVEN